MLRFAPLLLLSAASCAGQHYLHPGGRIERGGGRGATSENAVEPVVSYQGRVVSPLAFLPLFGEHADAPRAVIDLESGGIPGLPEPIFEVDHPRHGSRRFTDRRDLRFTGHVRERVWVRAYTDYGEVIDYDHLGHLGRDYHVLLIRFSGGTTTDARVCVIRRDGERLIVTGWLAVGDLRSVRHVLVSNGYHGRYYLEVIENVGDWYDRETRHILLNPYM